jgi:hypothetical protein
MGMLQTAPHPFTGSPTRSFTRPAMHPLPNDLALRDVALREAAEQPQRLLRHHPVSVTPATASVLEHASRAVQTNPRMIPGRHRRLATA